MSSICVGRSQTSIPLVRHLAIIIVCLGLFCGSRAVAGDDAARVANDSQSVAARSLLSNATPLGRQDPNAQVTLGFVLPLTNQPELNGLLRRLYDPTDALYGHYLTPQQFADRFGASQSDFAAVKQYVESLGLKVTSESKSRDLIEASGSSGAVEQAFNVKLNRFHLTDDRNVYANDRAPSIPDSIAAKLVGVVGFDNLAPHRPAYLHQFHLPSDESGALKAVLTRGQIAEAGTGPAGGMAPSDLKTAYSLGSTFEGTGTSVALLEFDGYFTTDITTYAKQFSIPTPTLVNVPVDGGVQTPGDGQDEVVLDIDMLLAMAPQTKSVTVYEAPITAAAGFADILNQFATDDTASVISVSWDSPEDLTDQASVDAENEALAQIATQGQTVCVASGDSGAYADAPFQPTGQATISVNDPASQPLAVGCGGTTLNTTGAGGPWSSETVWQGTLADAPGNGGGSGGGISTFWKKPAYQVGDPSLGQQPVGASPTMRDVPDVALDADPNTGPDIYVNADGGWLTVGGTSGAAPLWAGFLALVNQARTATGASTIGDPHAAIYAIGRTATEYPLDFHDITSGNNLFYDAQVGYDDCTGWGSFIGNALITQLSPPVKTGTLSGTVVDTNGALVGATISVTSAANGTTVATTTTGAGGAYTVKVPSTTTLTASASFSGDITQIVSGLTVPFNGTLTQNFSLVQAHEYSAGIQMISAPYEYTGIGTFAQVFALPSQSYFIWQADLDEYVENPLAPADTMHLGEAYWVNFTALKTPLQLLGNPAPATFRVTLQAGWNQISDPYLLDMPLSSVDVDTITPANPDNPVPIASSSDVSQTLYYYDATSGAPPYAAITTTSGQPLQTWKGYWIFANQACVLVMTQPT